MDGCDQHLGLDADAGRGAGEGGEGDEGLGVVEDEPVEQAERAERADVGAPGPGQEQGGVVDGKAETDLHGGSSGGHAESAAAPPGSARLCAGLLPFCGLVSRERDL